MFVHGTCVAIRIRTNWHAVLLRGESGAGKSDLALRLIDEGARLVADDQTHLAKKGRALLCTAPPALKSMIEVRGLGIVTLPRVKCLPSAKLSMLVDLSAPPKIERLPEPQTELILGVSLQRLSLAPFETSASAKLRLALDRIVAP